MTSHVSLQLFTQTSGFQDSTVMAHDVINQLTKSSNCRLMLFAHYLRMGSSVGPGYLVSWHKSQKSPHQAESWRVNLGAKNHHTEMNRGEPTQESKITTQRWILVSRLRNRKSPHWAESLWADSGIENSPLWAESWWVNSGVKNHHIELDSGVENQPAELEPEESKTTHLLP